MAAPTWLNNAFRLMQLPLGIFGVAVATITLPVVSRHRGQCGPDAPLGRPLGKALRLGGLPDSAVGGGALFSRASDHQRDLRARQFSREHDA